MEKKLFLTKAHSLNNEDIDYETYLIMCTEFEYNTNVCKYFFSHFIYKPF